MMTLIDTFFELVKIDSPSGSEENVRKWLIQWAKSRKLSHFTDSVGNLVLKKEEDTLIPFFLCAHMDTVEPGRSIHPIIQDGVIQSQGNTILGADNKASMAVILTAVDEWLLKKPINGIELVFTVKEETGGGAEFFDTKLIENKQGFIFDYAEPLGTIVTSAPYIVNFSIEFIGKGTHACFPEKGVNALQYATKYIDSLQLGANDEKDVFLNIGKIHGGSVVNAVPEKVVVEGEIRSFSRTKFENILEMLELRLSQIQKQFGNATFKFSTSGYCSGYTHKDNSKQVLFLEKILNNYKLPIKKKKVFGISDANSFAELELEVLTLSDGVIDPHTTSERISVDDLKKLQMIILDMLISKSQFKS